MCHQNFFLPKSGVGHVSWLIAYLIKRVLQLGPATLLLREHEVQLGDYLFKKGDGVC